MCCKHLGSKVNIVGIPFLGFELSNLEPSNIVYFLKEIGLENQL